MVILNKYKDILYLNYEHATEYEAINQINKPINYVFSYKTKFMRGFIYFYAIFLIFLNNSVFVYKNNPEFRLKISLESLLLVSNDYNDFLMTV